MATLRYIFDWKKVVFTEGAENRNFAILLPCKVGTPFDCSPVHFRSEKGCVFGSGRKNDISRFRDLINRRRPSIAPRRFSDEKEKKKATFFFLGEAEKSSFMVLRPHIAETPVDYSRVYP